MCGRFALGIPKKGLEELAGSVPDEYAPSWNLAPGRQVLALAPGGWRLLRWGVVPHWGRGAGAKPLINARCETVFEKPAFKRAAEQGRCLVPAQAFYEWRRHGAGKQPFAVALASGEPMFLAAIREEWEDRETGKVLQACAILTTRANSLMAPIHDRMPVIVGEQDRHCWLDLSIADVEHVQALFTPLPSDLLEAWPVSSAVNAVGRDGPELLRRLPEPPRQGSLI